MIAVVGKKDDDRVFRMRPGIQGVMSYTGVVDHLENRFYRATVNRP